MSYIDKARYAGQQVEFHRVKMGEWAEIRARNIARAADQDDPGVVAEALGVSRSAVYKAINAERDRVVREALEKTGTEPVGVAAAARMTGVEESAVERVAAALRKRATNDD